MKSKSLQASLCVANVKGDSQSPFPSEGQRTVFVKLKCRWKLFSWTALRGGLGWWVWKPKLRAEWVFPSSGWLGNQNETELVLIQFEWLSAYFEITVERPERGS